MAVTVTESFLTEKALDYEVLSDLAYASWDNTTKTLKANQSGYNEEWDALAGR
jgi:hypothetical protein